MALRLLHLCLATVHLWDLAELSWCLHCRSALSSCRIPLLTDLFIIRQYAEQLPSMHQCCWCPTRARSGTWLTASYLLSEQRAWALLQICSLQNTDTMQQTASRRAVHAHRRTCREAQIPTRWSTQACHWVQGACAAGLPEC